MGGAALERLLADASAFRVVALVRPSAKNKRWARRWQRRCRREGPGSLEVIWGDLCNFEDVLAGVTGAAYVLHVGGMVSPMADHYPQQTLKVNVSAARNIVRAVQAQPHPDAIKVVNIGSVAEYGDRNPPHHWGSVADPLCPVDTDVYAQSKVQAERLFMESGLTYWVSLRQSGMIHPNLLDKALDPITFHVPMQGVLEWATAEDSGQLMANVCQPWVPDSFWGRCYNISSGPSFRLTNLEFERYLLRALHCPPPEKIFDMAWFAQDHFHGMWYSDGQELEDILHFRANVPCEAYFKAFSKRLPWYISLARLVPAFVIKGVMHRVYVNRDK